MLEVTAPQRGGKKALAKNGEEARPPQTDWAARGLVAVSVWHAQPRLPSAPLDLGLNWKLYAGDWNQLPDFHKLSPVFTGASSNLHADPQGFTNYAVVWEGFIDIPADGGYTFYILSRDGARVALDGIELARTGPPFAQVCGSPGNAMRISRGALGLRAGRHALRIESLHTASPGGPRLLWEGPGVPLTDVPPSAYLRPRLDAITR
jgi:hypothetical protein